LEHPVIAGSLRRCGVLSDQPEFLLAFLACGVYAQALCLGSTPLSRSATPADRTASGSRCYRPAQAGRPPSPAACSPRPPPPSRPAPPRTPPPSPRPGRRSPCRTRIPPRTRSAPPSPGTDPPPSAVRACRPPDPRPGEPRSPPPRQGPPYACAAAFAVASAVALNPVKVSLGACAIFAGSGSCCPVFQGHQDQPQGIVVLQAEGIPDLVQPLPLRVRWLSGKQLREAVVKVTHGVFVTASPGLGFEVKWHRRPGVAWRHPFQQLQIWVTAASIAPASGPMLDALRLSTKLVVQALNRSAADSRGSAAHLGRPSLFVRL